MMESWIIECNFKNIWEYQHFVTNCAHSEIYPWSIEKLNDNLFEFYQRESRQESKDFRHRWHYTLSERDYVEAWMTWMTLRHLIKFTTVEHWRNVDYDQSRL